MQLLICIVTVHIYVYAAPLTEYCPGQEVGVFGSGSTVQAILNNLRSTFCGCKRIGGNINIGFPEMPTVTDTKFHNLTEDDFNFLYHVVEVGGSITFLSVPPIDRLTLPNLVLIRGNNLPYNPLVANGFALSLVSSQVDKLVLPKLVEITVGSMKLFNSTWCGYYTVNWDDIFEAGAVHLLPNNANLNFTAELAVRCSSENREGVDGCLHACVHVCVCEFVHVCVLLHCCTCVCAIACGVYTVQSTHVHLHE